MGLVVGLCTIIGCNPFEGFDGTVEFVNLPGAKAEAELEGRWPVSVDSGSVQAVSYKTAWTRDSSSSWYRVVLGTESAKKWIQYIHARQKELTSDSFDVSEEGMEGVIRDIPGPPPPHEQTGTTPSWWSPPASEVHATETMLWYTGYGSGVAWATYSGFDDSTNTLWIYTFRCQHYRLWSPGEMPPGTPIHSDARQSSPESAAPS